MSSDIKLGDDERVIVEGTYLEVRTTDIFLDNPERRGAGADPNIPRRALVHDFKDGLTLNFNYDYPGGVTIFGNMLNVIATDILLDHPARRSSSTGYRRALVHDFNDGLTLNYNADYPGGVMIRGDVNIPRQLFARNIEFEIEDLSTILPTDPVIGTIAHPRKRVDLKQVIYELQAEIAALKERLASLESR